MSQKYTYYLVGILLFLVMIYPLIKKIFNKKYQENMKDSNYNLKCSKKCGDPLRYNYNNCVIKCLKKYTQKTIKNENKYSPYFFGTFPKNEN